MLLEAKGGEMDAVAKHLRLGQDTDSTHSVELHFHVRVAVGVSKVRQMRPVRRVLGVALHDDGILIERIGKGQRGI